MNFNNIFHNIRILLLPGEIHSESKVIFHVLKYSRQLNMLNYEYKLNYLNSPLFHA